MSNCNNHGHPRGNGPFSSQPVCPFCRVAIAHTDMGAVCSVCHKTFPLKNGVLCFGTEDEFYEGKFIKTKEHWSPEQSSGFRKLLKRFYRTITISAYEARFFSSKLKRTIPSKDATILDFGCGGGAEILPRFGSVTGVDLSVSSLIEAQKLYDQVYQIDGERLPFADATFDCVFTSHVFGHVPLARKSGVISEIFRVIKPGGHLISSIECDSESIVYKRAKRFPDLFSKCYVEEWGHYGLELPDENFKRFRDSGFLPVIEIADIHKGYLRPATSYKNLVAFKGRDNVLYTLGLVSAWFETSPVATRVADFVCGLMVPLAFLFTPQSHRDSAKIVYQKPL